MRVFAAKVKILDVNQAVLDLYQATSREELLAGLHVTFTNDSYDSFREMLIAIADGLTVLDLDTAVQTLQGEKRDIQLRWAAATGSEETLAKVYVSQIDITERKRLQEAVTLRERQLESFFLGATAGLVLLDKDLRYLHINDTLAQMNGVPVAEHLGRTIREVVPELALAVEPFFQQVFTTGEPVLNIEVTGETPDRPGIQRHWTESFFPISGADGSPEGVGAIVVETTERKRAELHVRHLNEVLRAIRDIGELIVRERNDEKLLADACNTLVRTRGYQLAWIGGIVPDSKRVVSLASAGPAADYLDSVTITWDESETGRGPIGTALRERRTCVCQDTPPTPASLRGESRRWPEAIVRWRLRQWSMMAGCLAPLPSTQIILKPSTTTNSACSTSWHPTWHLLDRRSKMNGNGTRPNRSWYSPKLPPKPPTGPRANSWPT